MTAALHLNVCAPFCYTSVGSVFGRSHCVTAADFNCQLLVLTNLLIRRSYASLEASRALPAAALLSEKTQQRAVAPRRAAALKRNEREFERNATQRTAPHHTRVFVKKAQMYALGKTK